MRIIGGLYKGRRFKAPNKLPTRPTTDQAKEGLFNILINRLDLRQLCVLDLFSGIGSVSMEFLSRGVADLTSIDRNPKCVKFQDDCRKQLDIKNWTVSRSEVLKFLPNCVGKYDLIFADPPYDYENHRRIYELILEWELLKPNGVFILEHDSSLKTSDWTGFEQIRRYGRVHFSFFDQNLMK